MSREVGLTYSAPMAAAVWRDEKWQTRRTSGIDHVPEDADLMTGLNEAHLRSVMGVYRFIDTSGGQYVATPRLRVGDVMVVREPWRVDAMFDDISPAKLKEHAFFASEAHRFINYSDEPVPNTTWTAGRYRYAMHMPFAFARSRRVVTGVRVERLGDISVVDTWAEGVVRDEKGWLFVRGAMVCSSTGRERRFRTEKECFTALWDCVNGPGAFERDQRKWRFVYESERKGGR